jgi:hypothetical protein
LKNSLFSEWVRENIEKEVQSALEVKEVEEAFFAKGDLQEKPEQSPVV